MTPKDPAALARAYVDDALKLNGGKRPSDEDYDRAVAKVETAFRELAAISRTKALGWGGCVTGRDVGDESA